VRVSEIMSTCRVLDTIIRSSFKWEPCLHMVHQWSLCSRDTVYVLDMWAIGVSYGHNTSHQCYTLFSEGCLVLYLILFYIFQKRIQYVSVKLLNWSGDADILLDSETTCHYSQCCTNWPTSLGVMFMLLMQYSLFQNLNCCCLSVP